MLKTLLHLVLLFCSIGTLFCRADEGFTPISEVDESLASTIQAATVLIQSYHANDNLGKSCAGVWISNQGHLLTALHCLDVDDFIYERGDFHQNNQMQWISLFKEARSPESLYLDNVDIHWKGEVYASPQVILLGAGRLVERPTWYPWPYNDLSSETVATMAEYSSQDYAILKVDLKTPCLHNGSSHQTGQRVFSFGYPSRMRDHSPREDELFMAQGELLSGHEQSSFLQGLSAPLSGGQLKQLDQMFLPEGVLLTTLDSSCGMSGGPVINDQGQLVGINQLTRCHRSYREGTTMILDTLAIQQQSQSVLGSTEAFSCEN